MHVVSGVDDQWFALSRNRMSGCVEGLQAHVQVLHEVLQAEGTWTGSVLSVVLPGVLEPAMTEDQFLAGLVELIAQTDEDRLRHCLEMTHEVAMGEAYPRPGSEDN